MIAVVKTGRGFKGLANYLFYGKENEQRGKVLNTNMAGSSPKDWGHQFAFIRKLRPSLGKAVFHASIAFAPEDRKLEEKELKAIANEFMENMGFSGLEPFIVVEHQDTIHQHIHIAASRIKLDGTVISDTNNYRRAEAALRELEIKHGLRRVEGFKGESMQIERLEMIGGEEDGEASSKVNAKDIFGEEYSKTLKELFDSELKFIKRSKKYNNLFIRFKDGSSFYDCGDRIKASSKECDENTARRLISLAMMKNWAAISVSGSEKFVKEAMRLALEKGLVVVPIDESQKRLLEEMVMERQAVGRVALNEPQQRPKQQQNPFIPTLNLGNLSSLRKPSPQGKPKIK